mmetsp:Transcript_29220/g.73494  ORF Transcript_29220/g.73494 Transcript_29220/m.73494 type:complete len:242 (+) Transcript_29220:172-897(+)
MRHTKRVFVVHEAVGSALDDLKLLRAHADIVDIEKVSDAALGAGAARRVGAVGPGCSRPCLVRPAPSAGGPSSAAFTADWPGRILARRFRVAHDVDGVGASLDDLLDHRCRYALQQQVSLDSRHEPQALLSDHHGLLTPLHKAYQAIARQVQLGGLVLSEPTLLRGPFYEAFAFSAPIPEPKLQRVLPRLGVAPLDPTAEGHTDRRSEARVWLCHQVEVASIEFRMLSLLFQPRQVLAAFH